MAAQITVTDFLQLFHISSFFFLDSFQKFPVLGEIQIANSKKKTKWMPNTKMAE
jgi:hypothetical protein